jgi:hypothetical protein
MNPPPLDNQGELDRLIDRMCDGVAGVDELSALGRRLADDPAACEHYVACLDIHARLAWQMSPGKPFSGEELLSYAMVDAPIVIQSSPPVYPSWSSALLAPGGFLSSYVMASLILAVGLLVGWTWTISNDRQSVGAADSGGARSSRSPSGPASKSVGRVTGMVDCQWTDRAEKPIDPEHVPVGRRYSLAGGFMEIVYDSGAKVVLEGPAVYEINSASGGLLLLGKLTARVEKKGPGFRSQGSEIRTPKSDISNPQSPIPNPLFSVHTPTAVITDLGTEFGVEVDRLGAIRAHVFQGCVDLRPIDGRAVRLQADESARVERRADHGLAVIREKGRAVAFYRQLPEGTPIAVFSTGRGLKPGDADPHWRVVAGQGGSMTGESRPAVVVAAGDEHMPNNPLRSQWISTWRCSGGKLQPMPWGWYTFRTTFELAGGAATRAVLRGRFLADNCVEAVRLNGVAIPVPDHRTSAPFTQPHSFTAKKGFVGGTNVLEIDVYNLPTLGGDPTPMALRVELEGIVLGASRAAADDAPGGNRHNQNP